MRISMPSLQAWSYISSAANCAAFNRRKQMRALLVIFAALFLAACSTDGIQSNNLSASSDAGAKSACQGGRAARPCSWDHP
jgi:hypothetical protein